MNILVFDNYDSFTYNLVHIVEKLCDARTSVFENDAITLDDAAEYDAIILSPGPGIPEEAGLLLPLIERFAPSKPILGVCLGHQAIGIAFGAVLRNTELIYHGVATKMIRTAIHSPIFAGLPKEFDAGRYHSWIVERESLPPEFDITAVDENGFIMAMQHKTFNLQSVQFHPESILTPRGEAIIKNWLNSCASCPTRIDNFQASQTMGAE